MQGRGMDTGQGISTNHTFMPRLAHFAAELGRRRVWRTALAYGAVVFVLLQIGEIVFPAFGAPDWALRLLVVACFLGLPIVLCLAWVFDITPTGIKKTLGVTHPSGSAWGPGRALPRVALLAVMLSTVGGLGWWTIKDTLGASAVPQAPGNSGGLLAADSPGQPPVVRSLAVLPLDDFSEDEGGAYFTAGLHEEIVSRLSQTGAARVVSRTSVVQYDRSGKTMPTIASDLGVDAVLEGSVFRAGDRVRITVQLIYGPTDTHLWAESYEGTLEDAIALQREVAGAIAEGIREEIAEGSGAVPPSPRVARAVSVPDEYRMGRRDEAKGTPEALASAIEHYQKVLEEDSSFVPARAGLTTARIRLDSRHESGTGSDPSHRIADARRLAAASHYQEAEGILREVTQEVEASEEAWRALEQIKAIKGDFEGVVEVRLQRLSGGPSDSGDSIALLDLRNLIQERGEEGYWIWKVGELKGLAEGGGKVSSVELARACVGVGDLEAVFPHLEKALEDGDRNLVTLWTDPAWDVLRSDPRFSEILTRVRRSVPGGGHPFPDLPWPKP
jgi:TolB-like protein